MIGITDFFFKSNFPLFLTFTICWLFAGLRATTKKYKARGSVSHWNIRRCWSLHKFWFVNVSLCCFHLFPPLSGASQEQRIKAYLSTGMPGGCYCYSSHHLLNTPAGGFSIERQWATQLSTLHFIYDKLKSALISARRRVLNQCLEQHVYLAAKASGVGARGRHPFTEITQNIFSPSKCRAGTGSVIVFMCLDAGA